jgi:hypothetical protein
MDNLPVEKKASAVYQTSQKHLLSPALSSTLCLVITHIPDRWTP